MIARMLAAGVAGLRRQVRLALGLYLVQALAAFLVTVTVAVTLGGRLAGRPILDRAVAGDLAALMHVLGDAGGAVAALLAAGLAVALAWGVLSWYLTAGLLGALDQGAGPGGGARFAEAAAARFGAFGRLWAWSLLPWTASLVALGVGLALGGDALDRAMAPGTLVGRTLVCAGPGLLLAAFTSCAVDYARLALVVDRRLGAGRALLGSARLLLRNPVALAHFLLYVFGWVGVTALYVQGTLGARFAGAAGGLALFGLRQLVALLRHGLRVVAWGGQLELLDVEPRLPPSKMPESQG